MSVFVFKGSPALQAVTVMRSGEIGPINEQSFNKLAIGMPQVLTPQYFDSYASA